MCIYMYIEFNLYSMRQTGFMKSDPTDEIDFFSFSVFLFSVFLFFP